LKRAVPDSPGEPNFTANPSKIQNPPKYFSRNYKKSEGPFSFSKKSWSQTIPSFQPPLNIAKFFKVLNNSPKF
jgi:hypothetical protein